MARKEYSCVSFSQHRDQAASWTTEVRFPAGTVKGLFFFATTSRPAPRLAQPPIQWAPRTFSLEVKQSGRETDH
jgi:hypothetical protein